MALTYTVTDVSQLPDNGGGTFTGVNIGAVAADRIIVVTILVDGTVQVNSRPSSVTVGGVAMTNATGTSGETPSGGGAGVNNYIYYLLAPAGVLNASSATVQVTTPFCLHIGIAVGNINGDAAAFVNAFNGSAWQGGGTISDPRGVPNDLAGVAVASGGVVVTGFQIDRSGTYTPNGSSIIIDYSQVDGQSHDMLSGHGTSGSPSINGATNFNANFVIAAFSPSATSVPPLGIIGMASCEWHHRDFSGWRLPVDHRRRLRKPLRSILKPDHSLLVPRRRGLIGRSLLKTG